jgi:hypothetical protein
MGRTKKTCFFHFAILSGQPDKDNALQTVQIQAAPKKWEEHRRQVFFLFAILSGQPD